MKKIDLGSWPRARHYELFKDYDHPFFNMTAELDITKLYKQVKREKRSFFASMLYHVMHVANQIPEFRYRIRGKDVVEHDRVHPSYTVMFEDELFGFVTTDFAPGMDDFCQRVDEDIDHAELSRSLEDDPNRDDLIYVSAVPWVSFTSVSHPWDTKRQDSFPRITWGKFYKKNERVFIPLSIAAHHALCDGVHIGKFFKQLTHAIENIDLSA